MCTRCCLSCCVTSRLKSSLVDAASAQFWRALLAEGLGTFVLVLVGCGSCIGNDWETFAPTTVQISLTFGLAVATIVWCIAHVSGGHINPAVTVAMLVARKISLLRAVLFVCVQCAGAILGAMVLMLLTPPDVLGSLGMTTVQKSLRCEQAFGVEMCITFVLVVTVFASCDSYRPDMKGSAPLSIGFSVTLCHLFAIKYTGASMNPARTLGPAVVMILWDNHWVYWAGPISGGVAAALLYEIFFSANTSPKKMRHFFLRGHYDESNLVDTPTSKPPSTAREQEQEMEKVPMNNAEKEIAEA